MTFGGGAVRRWALVGVLFFASGFTGLLYEVIWAKYLALVLGSSAHAQIGVLAVFMGGIALGGVLWGRYADRVTDALRLYAGLEIGIGLCAAGFVWSFDGLTRVYRESLATAGADSWHGAAIKVAMCVVAMCPATLCMGGTLPVVTRALIGGSSHVGRALAYLYALNSFGAVAGAVLTGFYLVPRWGFDPPFLAAAAGNVAIGVVALMAKRWAPPAPAAAVVTERSDAVIEDVRGYLPLLLSAAMISGAAAMVYEVAWTRLWALVLGSSTYAFAIMLAAFIVGIAAGSFCYMLTDAGKRRPFRFFAYAMLVGSGVMLLCLPLYDRLPFYAGRLLTVIAARQAGFGAYQAATLVWCVLVMLPLTFVSGLTFPALTQAAARALAGTGRSVGGVLSANTLGTIIGATAGGLVLLPACGVRGTLLVAASASLLVACAVLLCDRALPRRRVLRLVAACMGALAAYAVAVPGWDVRLLSAGEYRSHAGIEADSFNAYRGGLTQDVVYYRDGVTATVSVEERAGDRVLRVNGKPDASVSGDADTELLLGHIGPILHGAAQRVLVIGYGSGITVGALLQYPVVSVDVVEISPEVIAAHPWFRQANHDALHDPRVHVHVEDARTFLYRATQPYDVIISEPSNPWVAGIGNLFSSEFFDQIRSRLAPAGLLIQWSHTYESSDALVALILRTVSDRFGSVRVFQADRWDFIVVASAAGHLGAPAAMHSAFQHAAELARIGITRPSTLLGLETLTDRMVRALVGQGDRNRDRFPELEYGAPRAFFEGAEARLFTRVAAAADAGWVLSTTALTAEDCAELVRYYERAELLVQEQPLRILVTWLARVPEDAAAIAALGSWMSQHPNSQKLVPALVAASADLDDQRRVAFAHLVLRSVGSSRLVPLRDDVRAAQPVIETAVLAVPPAAEELLLGLADLYARIGDRPQALSMLARLPETAATAEQWCARGALLTRLGQATAAHHALARCPTAAVGHEAAALQRLGVDPTLR